MGLLNLILGVGGKIVDKVWPDRSKQQEKHLDIQAETERSSGGRMTPYKAFGYVLVFWFVWEIFVRSTIVFYWPEAKLPPAMLKEAFQMLGTYFGMGW